LGAGRSPAPYSKEGVSPKESFETGSVGILFVRGFVSRDCTGRCLANRAFGQAPQTTYAKIAESRHFKSQKCLKLQQSMDFVLLAEQYPAKVFCGQL
jgi:hypothetical protein